MKNSAFSDSIYKDIFEFSSNGMFFFDKNGIIIDCNITFLESINSTRELMIGFDTINMLKNKNVIKAIKECLKTGKGFYEGIYISVTGNKKIYARGIFKALRNKDEEIVGGVCIMEDISTEYNQKQKLIDLNKEYATLNQAYIEQNDELQSNNLELNDKYISLEKEQKKNLLLLKEITIIERNYRTIFYNSPLPMIVHSKGEIVLINDAAAEFAEIKDKNEVIGKTVLSFVHESSMETAKNNISRVMKGEQTNAQKEKFINFKGEIKDVLVNSSQFIYNKEKAILVAFADISEITRVNEELIQKNKLIKLESEKNKEILNKLSIAESNYQAIFNNSPIPIILHGKENIIIANDSALDFYGVTEESDYITKTISSFIHIDSHEAAFSNIEKVYSGQESDLIELKFLNNKGEVKDVLLKSCLFTYNNEMVILASFVDITEFKEYKEKYRLISKGIETSPASIVITNSKGIIEFVNSNFTVNSGYSSEDSIGANPNILSSGKHKPEFYKNMWDVISSGNSWHGEVCNKTKSGELYWEYAIISPILNEKGNITHYIAIKENITKRREIEQKLVANEKYFKTLYETAPDGIFEINAEGIITNCNIEFANSVKLSKSILIGKKASSFIKNPDLFETLFNKLKRKGYVETEIVQRNADGSTTMVWRKASGIYDKNNNFTGAIAYNRDVSKMKEFEKELIEAKEKAEDSDRLKSAFLSNMSHEVRTPLNAIIGFSELLNKQNISPININKYSNYIKHNSKLLLNLINDIIDVSKIEANQIKISKNSVDINSIFNELHQIFLEENKENKNNVKLLLNISTNPVIFYTDEYRLRQIITNLISNALKFTNIGEITYGYKMENEEIKFFVKDTGQGVSEEFAKKIFTRFFKSGTLTNNKGGTGIGLSIVKSLTELLGGEIGLITEKDVGSEFIITFPYDSECEEKHKNKDKKFELSDFDWRNKTILIAEDDDFNFIVLDELLKMSNINVIHAKNGKEAIKLFNDHKNVIDIVLMDIQMPIMNGYEATNEILKIDKDAKVIAQTAFAMSNEKNNSIENGFIDYITKPIDIDELTLILANYLR
jgi:PAS domain S-box-containing protein